MSPGNAHSLAAPLRLHRERSTLPLAPLRLPALSCAGEEWPVRADLGGHLKYSRRWSGVRAGVLLGAQGAVRRGESRGGL